jgi:hypothetical protein
MKRSRRNQDDNVIEIPRLTYTDFRAERHVVAGWKYPSVFRSPTETALRNARENARFCAYQDAGLVRAVALIDEEPYDCGDDFTPEGLPNKSKRERDYMRDKFYEKVNRDGVWGIVLQYRTSADDASEWQDADSLWSVVVFNESKEDSLPYFAAHDMDLDGACDALESAVCDHVASL